MNRRGKHGNHVRGPKHSSWNEGRILSSHGYVKIRVGPGHPLADPNGYAYEHLMVWVTAGNKFPAKGEIIHHRNEHKTDNRLANLEIMSRVEHSKKHHDMIPDELVLSIRERYANGEKGTDLAKEYNIPFQRVYRFLHGETRMSAGGPIQTKNLRK